HECLGALEPSVVERSIVHSGIPLYYDKAEVGGLGRLVGGSIDDHHLLPSIMQSASHQAANRTEANDDNVVGKILEFVFHPLVLPKRHYGVAGKYASQC